jgi:CRP-like cAMP-binding protein
VQSNARGRRYVEVMERTIYLRSIPVAAELPPRVLHAIASCLREQSFESGAVLMSEGEPVSALELLTEGELSLHKGGKEIGRLAPPQSLGFLNIIARSGGGYEARAEKAVRALELDADVLIELMEEHSSLLFATLRYAAERLLYEMIELPADALSLPSQGIPFEIPDRPLDLVERILYLRTLAVFKKTNLNALAVISQEMREMRFEAGEELWGEGDTTPSSLMIVAGEVSCSVSDGRSWKYGPGTVVGGVESLARKPHWYAARTATPVVGLRGMTEELFDVFEDNFNLAMDFVSMLASGLQGLLARKAAMGQSSIGTMRNVSKLGAVKVGA